MNSRRQLLLATLLGSLLPVLAGAQTSPLFDGETADLWLYDRDTGQVTGYDTGTWLEQVNPGDYPGIDLGPNTALLINQLARSLAPMTPGQPAVSLAGIGDAALQIGDGGEGGHRDLVVEPASGTYTQTIAVRIGVSAAVLDGATHNLSFSAVNNATGATVAQGSRELLPASGLNGENGYHFETFYLVDGGPYSVQATIAGPSVNATAERNYELVIAPGEARRDTDGDGIPDAVEIDMGLNPLEDDWRADTDGNGWSQFDEWLRRYCLDPATLLPLDSDAACLDEDGLPRDSDNDNWSDFDETLRGTQPLDPEPVIEDPAGADPTESEYVARERLRYKDFPAAGRLYEIEYRVPVGGGVLDIPPAANLLPDRPAGGTGDAAASGIVVQSYTPIADNIAGIDFRLAPTDESGVEDLYVNVWATAPRSGELLLTRKLDDVLLDDEPDQLVALRFEPVAVQPGEPLFIEFRKDRLSLVASSADWLPSGALVETEDAAADLDIVIYQDDSFAGGRGGTRAGFEWSTVGATPVDSAAVYDASTLLSDEEITAASVLAGDIAERRRRSALAAALATNNLPEMRLPAGNSIVINAVHRHRSTGVAGDRYLPLADYSRIYKTWLPRRDDLTPMTMLTETGPGEWSTPDEWRREFVTFLATRLVETVSPTLDETSTLGVAAIEAALSDEASLDGRSGLFLLDGSTPQAGIDDWEDALAELAAANYNIDQVHAGVATALQAGTSLAGVNAWLRQGFYSGLPGSLSDHYLASGWVADSATECHVPDADAAALQADLPAWNEFLDRCPAWLDDAALVAALDAARERRYRLRLHLLPGAAAELALDPTLDDGTVDSDNDGLANENEVRQPVRDLTLPWLFDSDGDGVADLVDICPRDPFDDCSAQPIGPNVSFSDDFDIAEPASGSDFALIGVHIDRLYDVPVTVCYEAFQDVEDTAVAGDDFDPVAGCVTIAPGQLSALIRVPVNADGEDDAGENFSVAVTSIVNGQIADDGIVVVTITEPVATGNRAPVFTSAMTHTAPPGTVVTGYTATAIDPDDDTVTYSISGGADQAAFAIDANSGAIVFVVEPVTSPPGDANGDNVYELELSASDGNGGIDTLALAITVLAADNYLAVVFPTPFANLGGVSMTRVAGTLTQPNGEPVDTADVEFVDVNGQLADLDFDNPGRWSANVPVVPGDNTLTVTMQLSDNTTDSLDVDVANFLLHAGFDDIEVDIGNNRAIVIDGFTPGLLSIDLANGERSLLSGDGVGAGVNFDSPRDVILDLANNRAFVAEWREDAIYAVDLATGERSVFSGATRGNGPTLDGPQSLTLDAAANRLLVVTTVESIIYAVDLDNGDRSVFSSSSTGDGPPLPDPRHIVMDVANERALVSDDEYQGIVTVDLANGDRFVMSGLEIGDGPIFQSPDSMVLDPDNNRLLVAELGGYVIAMDLTTGNRSILTDYRPVFGTNNTRFDGIAVDAVNNRILISDSRADAIHTVNRDSGIQGLLSVNSAGFGVPSTHLTSIQGMAYDAERGQLLLTRSGNPAFLLNVWLDNATRGAISGGSFGAGQDFSFPQRVVVDSANARAIVTDASANAVFAVALDNGDRSILSNNVSVGTGPALADPGALALDAANERLFVLDTPGVLLSIDVNTGDRSIVSNESTGTGPLWSFPRALEFDPASGTVYVLDYTTDVLYAVDPATGNRSIVSDNTGTGTGVSFSVPYDLVLNADNDRILVVDYGGINDAVIAVSLANGDRSVISGAGIGSGVPLLNPYYINLDAANDRAFVYDVAVTGVLVIDLESGQRAIAAKY